MAQSIGTRRAVAGQWRQSEPCACLHPVALTVALHPSLAALSHLLCCPVARPQPGPCPDRHVQGEARRMPPLRSSPGDTAAQPHMHQHQAPCGGQTACSGRGGVRYGGVGWVGIECTALQKVMRHACHLVSRLTLAMPYASAVMASTSNIAHQTYLVG